MQPLCTQDLYITASIPKFPSCLPHALISDMSFEFHQNVTLTELFCPQIGVFYNANLCQAQ